MPGSPSWPPSQVSSDILSSSDSLLNPALQSANFDLLDNVSLFNLELALFQNFVETATQTSSQWENTLSADTKTASVSSSLEPSLCDLQPVWHHDHPTIGLDLWPQAVEFEKDCFGEALSLFVERLEESDGSGDCMGCTTNQATAQADPTFENIFSMSSSGNASMDSLGHNLWLRDGQGGDGVFPSPATSYDNANSLPSPSGSFSNSHSASRTSQEDYSTQKSAKRSSPITYSPQGIGDVDSEAARKRHRNTIAARKYRQKRLDRIKELEEALETVKKERDDLRVKLARQEAEAQTFRSLLQMKQGN